MESDILDRLRQGWLAHWDTDVRFVMVYASEWMRLTNLTIEAADEIKRLRDERDEARREVCNMNESGLRMNDSDKQREAKRSGWDCFKEGEA